MLILNKLIEEARTTLGSVSCSKGNHIWESDGGRSCPKPDVHKSCSQTVYKCSVCGTHDYGDKGGPAWTECFIQCKEST